MKFFISNLTMLMIVVPSLAMIGSDIKKKEDVALIKPLWAITQDIVNKDETLTSLIYALLNRRIYILPSNAIPIKVEYPHYKKKKTLCDCWSVVRCELMKATIIMQHCKINNVEMSRVLKKFSDFWSNDDLNDFLKSSSDPKTEIFYNNIANQLQQNRQALKELLLEDLPDTLEKAKILKTKCRKAFIAPLQIRHFSGSI